MSHPLIIEFKAPESSMGVASSPSMPDDLPLLFGQDGLSQERDIVMRVVQALSALPALL